MTFIWGQECFTALDVPLQLLTCTCLVMSGWVLLKLVPDTTEGEWGTTVHLQWRNLLLGRKWLTFCTAHDAPSRALSHTDLRRRCQENLGHRRKILRVLCN